MFLPRFGLRCRLGDTEDQKHPRGGVPVVLAGCSLDVSSAVQEVRALLAGRFDEEPVGLFTPGKVFIIPSVEREKGEGRLVTYSDDM